jgi:hypothetical protein
MTNFEFVSVFLVDDFDVGLDLRRQQQQHKLAIRRIMKMNIAEHPIAINVIYVEKSELKSKKIMQNF